MQKSSLKLYFATFVLTLSLAPFTFAGNIQCPVDGTPPPPPPIGDDGRMAVPVVNNTDPSVDSTNQFLKGFWEFLAQNTDLF